MNLNFVYIMEFQKVHLWEEGKKIKKKKKKPQPHDPWIVQELHLAQLMVNLEKRIGQWPNQNSIAIEHNSRDNRWNKSQNGMRIFNCWMSSFASEFHLVTSHQLPNQQPEEISQHTKSSQPATIPGRVLRNIRRHGGCCANLLRMRVMPPT